MIHPIGIQNEDRRALPDRRRYYRNSINYNEAKDKAVAEFEQHYLISLLLDSKGNVTLAANLAGKERRCLGKLIKKHQIDLNLFR
jgi:two-component system response regulator GlrR